MIVPRVKFMKASDLKSYLYRSKAKVDWLYQQAHNPRPQASLTWKLSLGFTSLAYVKKIPAEISGQQRLDAVIAALEERKQIGTLAEGRDYVKGVLDMRWGVFNDEGWRPDTEGPLVYFSGISGDILLGLGGSSIHIGNPYGIGATGSCSHTSALHRWLRSGLDSGKRPPRRYEERETEEYQIAEAMALANRFLKGPPQSLEFVSKVLWRGEGYRLRPGNMGRRGEVILGTPLYVAQVETKIVDGL